MAQFVVRGGISVVVFVLLALVHARNKSPLIDDDTRTRNKAAECIFGKEIRELGSVWTPDLGNPMGVLYCMRCECVGFQRKRRIVARVQCRNIKNECPEPTCKEPELQPGRCCKSCPGDSVDVEVFQDVIQKNINEDDDHYNKHFYALLSGRSALVLKNDYGKLSSPDYNENNVVGHGRFTFHKRNLHYSLEIAEKAARPRSLQFVDDKDNILEEFILSYPGGLVNSVYQNATRKICGVFKRLARDYRRLLKSEHIYVMLIWGVKDQAEFTLSGRVMRHPALTTELFSSLLEPAPGTSSHLMAGAGGTAIVSISTILSTATPTIHIAITFNGLFTKDDRRDVPINISLTTEDKKQIVLMDKVLVEEPAPDINRIEIKAMVTPSQLRLLTRGRLLLSVSSMSEPDALKLSGNIITKTTCEMFQTTLVSSEHSANPYGTSGVAWMYLNNAGSLIYSIEIDNLTQRQQPAFITLMDTTTKRKTELEDLTPSYHDGWANGTLDKLTAKLLEPLYAGTLVINVATPNESSLIRGKLTPKLVSDARDAPGPILMKSDNSRLVPKHAAGIAWVSVDNDCHIQYDVSLTGMYINNRSYELYIEMFPILAPGAPYINKHLEDFRGNQVEGSPVEVLTREEIMRLDSGVSFLKVKDYETHVELFTGTVKNVRIPQMCLMTAVTDNNVPTLFDHEPLPQDSACYYEEKFYQDETSWASTKDSCKMCFCQRGLSKCDIERCTELNCPGDNKTFVPGECCPICADLDISHQNIHKKCVFQGREYSPSSKFHPFLIPTGFDLCTECTCDPDFLEIKCSRLGENCRKQPQEQGDVQLADDQVPVMISLHEQPRKEATLIKLLQNASRSPPQKIMNEGGCTNLKNPKQPHENGTEYHPYIPALGEYKCITCKCENGNQKCSKQQCDPNSCKTMRELKRNKKPINMKEFCCSMKECRKLRHRRNSRHNITS